MKKMIQRYDPKRILLTSTGFLILSASLAKVFIHAKNGLPLETTGAAAVGWIAYIAIHKSETGEFIDARLEEKKLPDHDKNWLHLALSAFLFALGMIYGANGVGAENTVQATAGAATVMTGYFIAHFEFSDHIV